jgi:hypothetical protein
MALDFPTSPANNQVYNNYYYDSLAGVWRSLGGVYGPNFLKNPTFTTGTTTGVPVTVQRITSQTSNLQEWKKEDNTTLVSIDKDGNLSLQGTSSITDSRTLSINSLGYAGIRLNSDTSNAGVEPGGSFLTMGNDAGQDFLALSAIQNAGYSGIDDNSLYGETLANSMLLGTTSSRVLHFGTNNSVRMTIDTSGITSTPYQPTFAARSSQATTQGNDVVWSFVDFNVGSNYNSSNGRFTAPTTGYYYFHAHGLWNNAATGDLRITLYKNGSAHPGMRTINYKGSAYWLTWSIDGVVYMASGDYTTVRVDQLTNGLHTDNNYNQFSGYFLG